MILFDRRLGMASFQPCGFFGVSDQWARRWRCRNCTRHEIERRPDKALGARFRFTVPKFSDCPDGAVRNGYPKLDLPWENVIAGPWGWPRSTVLAQVPARHPPCDGSGRLRFANG